MNIIDENNYTQEGGEGFFLGVLVFLDINAKLGFQSFYFS